MADELRLIFIIIGALVLGALLLHGLWTVRKNAGQPKHRYLDETTEAPAAKADGFDELGVGQVRVVKKAGRASEAEQAEAAGDNLTSSSRLQHTSATPQSTFEERAPEVQTELPFDEPQEPKLNFSALADEDDSRVNEPRQNNTALADEVAVEDEKPGAAEPAEVLILYVLLPEHKEMKGPDLLSALLTLGFKYGDMDIFHRHQDSAGSGAVLFSLANMFNPGTFDLENIDKLSTRGVSLFMTLPGPGEPLGNFNLMHNAAKKLAEEFGGQVLDGQRSVLTVQTVRHYVDKIREFQRQQLIHG